MSASPSRTREGTRDAVRRLEEDLALEILNTLAGDRYLEYAEAWAAASAATPPKR